MSLRRYSCPFIFASLIDINHQLNLTGNVSFHQIIVAAGVPAYTISTIFNQLWTPNRSNSVHVPPMDRSHLWGQHDLMLKAAQVPSQQTAEESESNSLRIFVARVRFGKPLPRQSSVTALPLRPINETGVVKPEVAASASRRLAIRS